MSDAQLEPARRSAGPYHHGALRAALIAGAREILRERGHDAFSLNELARRIGVSPAAAYRHFENREALLRAVSFEGYEELHAALTRPMAAGLDPGSRVIEIGVRYVAFSADNADLFLTMFRYRPIRPGETVTVDAFAPLMEAVGAAQATGQLPAGETRQIALVIWTSLHGLTVLYLNGALTALGLIESPYEAARTSLQIQFPGLKP
jgi:AcrR family transcriptional regulator